MAWAIYEGKEIMTMIDKEAPGTLTATQYVAVLGAFSSELSRQCDGATNTAALACKTERADLLVQYLGLHEELSQLQNAVAAMRVMSRLYPDSCTDILHECEMQVSAYERAFKDFESRFVSGNEQPGSDEMGERLHRIELQLLRLGEIKGTLADLVAEQRKQSVQERRQEYLDKVAKLSQTESEVFHAASDSQPLRGEKIVEKTPNFYNGVSKAALSHLVKLNLLKKVTGGYQRVPCPSAESQD